MDPIVLAADTGKSTLPLALGTAGVLVAVLLWMVARSRRVYAIPLRFLAVVGGTWSILCVVYVITGAATTFSAYLQTSTLATGIIAAVGVVCYLAGYIAFRPAERRWKESSAVVTGVALMGSAFLRATYQPDIALWLHAPIGVLLVATVWRLRAEPLVYASILGVAVMLVLGARDHLASGSDLPTSAWVTSTAAGVSLLMVCVAAILALSRRKTDNVRWYRQGLLIVPLVVSSLAAMGAGYAAVWYGPSWHTVWALGTWWAVLLVSAIGLRQADLFGFSCVGAALAAVVAFAVLGGGSVRGYWGLYPSVLMVIAMGAALLAASLARTLEHTAAWGFPRALYLAGTATAMAALVLEPFETTPKHLGVHLLLAAIVLALAHAHRAPAWVNYLTATLATGGVAALTHVRDGAPADLWHHRFIQVTASVSVGWLVVAVVLREILKRTASDRTARRQVEPFTVFGMTATIVLAAYLSVQQVRAFEEFLTASISPTLPMLGPGWGLAGWGGVLVAFLLSMWLFRHTARTFLFYTFGIMAATYLGLFRHTGDLYGYLIYSVAGYGATHLLVYLYEARFMALLARVCAVYREERRASTTIFTLAVISCFIGAMLAMFRLSSHEALIMLGLMTVVFLGWSFVWLRGEMLYPGVFMLTLAVLAIWHNTAHPLRWDAHRLSMNALIMAVSALVWLGFGNRLHAMRGEVFQLAAPARACSAILGLVGMAFAVVLALSPTYGSEVWRQTRTLADWAMGLMSLSALILYFAWAGFVFKRRFYSLVSGFAVLLLGLYVGIYVGVRLSNS